MSHLIRNPHYALIVLTVIIFSAWPVLKTDKSSSDSDIRDLGAGRHAVSQVSELPSTTESSNPSGTKNASTASVKAKEIVKTKTGDTHARTQLVAVTEEQPAGTAQQANKAKGPHARPVISDPKALRRFGKGAPFVIGDLPAGKLKENLLTLTPNHRAKALKWLHSFNFSGIDAIESLRVDNTGGIFYTCPDTDAHGKACAHHSHAATASAITAEEIVEGTSELTAPVVAAAAVSVSSPPVYNSKPSAPNHIYLDFNGGVISTNTAWGGPAGGWDVEVWSQDGDFTTFNDSEQAWMRRVYERIAEDYAPFNVNVTTDAATYDPDNTGGLNNVGWLLHCKGTDKNGVDLPHAGKGGVAYVGVFGASDFASTYQPAWVSSTNGGGNEAVVAEASSHEMGHNMGLSHDTRSDEGYYGGHGSGDTSWGPIMGTGYGQNVTQWSKGEYFDSKHASWNGSSYDNHENTNDDLAIISARVSYRTDDHGDSTGAATEITPLGDGSINQTGIIETTDDPDVFQFSTGAGSITLNANPYKCDADTSGGNLDIIMELYDGGSNLIASNNPTANTYASISTTVAAGNYSLIVKPTGVGTPLISTPTGYTVYGSVGQYTITGNVILPSVSVTEAGGTTVIEGGATDTYSLVLSTQPSSNVTVTITPDSQVTVDTSSVTFTTSDWSTPQTVTVTAVDDSTEDGSHTGTISHVATSSDPVFNGVGVGSVIANIIDNDNIVVTSPNGGESFGANTVREIQWSSLLGGNVKIELLKSGGSTTIVASTPNDGSYDWSIPQFQALAIDYSIRITSVETPSKTDTGDGYFTIIEVLTPDYFTDLESDPGFTTTGDWEWGSPSGSNYASSAYSGSKMYDTHLSDTAFNTSVLTSTAIDCSSYTGITLEFWSHILLYDPDFTVKFEVSNDNSTWNILFEQTGLIAASWTKYTYDISTYANGQSTVYVRWAMVRNGSSVNQYIGGGIALDDIKLTGTYTSPVTTYSVTYHGNGNTGGSAPTDPTAYEELATVTVLGNTENLVKTGYAFTGWNTQAGGGGVSYSPAATFPMGTSDVTLYAQWAALPPSYAVVYDGNGNTGGAVPTDSTAYEELATVTVLGNTGNLVKTGYSFTGWNTQTGGGGVSYSPAATFSMAASDVTLYAQWTALPPSYAVVYDGNGNTGGSVPTDASTYEESATVIVLGNTGILVKTGYTFTGWNTQAGGGGVSYAQDDTFSIGASDVTLYAQWTALPPSYAVVYDGNGNTGGSVPTDPSTYEEFVTVIVSENTGNLTRAGYDFSDWNTQTDGGGVSYSPAATFPMGVSDVTLFAQWTELPPYITSDSPGYATPTTAPLTQITVNFNKAMEPTSFSTGADIISFTGPSGIDLSSVIAVATATWIDPQTLTIDFSSQPQSTEGFYRLVLGPDLADLAGNFIDQDQDTFIAEPLEDSYSAYALIGESGGSESTFWSDLVGADNTAAAWVFAGTNSSWNTGSPTETPTAGPGAAFDGNTIIAQNLGGNYNINEVSNATTPTIDASAYTGVSLVFQGWKEAGKNDTLYIDASSDNGGNWQRVYTYTAPNGGTSDGAWTSYTVDLSAYDNSSTLKLRWGLIDNTTGNSGEHTGWQIDAIEVKGTSAATPAPAPKVLTHSPTGEIIATASSIWIEFSQPMDTASGFPLAGIKSFTGPSGATAITATGSSWVNESMLRIDFPAQSAIGSYSLVLDSQIQDVNGIALDQDADGTAGETADTYDATFSIGSLPVDHFVISPITGAQTVGAPITGITITAKDSSNETVLDFTGTVTFAGTAGITGSSPSFVDGAISNVSLIPTVVGSDLTLTVDDGSSHTGSVIFTVLSKFQSWADGNTTFSADTNNDGITDGLAWLLGSHEPSANALSLTPAGNSNSGGDLIMTFNYLNAANRGSAVMSVQYSQDMGVTDLWANHTVVIPESSGTVNGVIFIIIPNGNFNEVQATVPAGAPDSPIFGRVLGDAPAP